jgi:hypothetical protein
VTARRPSPFSLALQLVALATLVGSALFFRRKGKQDPRAEAYRELFAILTELYESAARLKPLWVARWERRREEELPPKHQPENLPNPLAVEAAYDLKFGRALLYQNRWRSQTQPLFDDLDRGAWMMLRAEIIQLPIGLMQLRDSYADHLRADELDWLDRAVEAFDQARYQLRQAERDDATDAQLVADAAFTALYATTTLSTRLIDRLRYEAGG